MAAFVAFSLLIGCGGAGVSDRADSLRCGYIEADDSPRAANLGACWVVFASPGALLTTAGSEACQVSQVGTDCLVVRSGEYFSVWQEVDGFGMVAAYDVQPFTTDCDATDQCAEDNPLRP